MDLGGSLLVDLENEPLAEGSPLSTIFDWTVAVATYEWLSWHKAGVSQQSQLLLTTVSTEKLLDRIPRHRIQVWIKLTQAQQVDIVTLRPGWSSGALRRDRQAKLGDVLVVVGGAEGVEHLTQLYVAERKPVVAFDLDIGSSTKERTSAAVSIYRATLNRPEEFLRVKAGRSVGSLLAQLSTCNGNACLTEVVKGFRNLIESLADPLTFYVRLLDEHAGEYPAVERFFRNVVDVVTNRFGFERIQMGLDSSGYAWMNQAIFENIHRASMVVADLTGLRCNCFMELGYALGRSRRTVITAQKGTKLPFDVDKLQVYFWDDQRPDDERIREFERHWLDAAKRPPLCDVHAWH